ncbi:M23 family metallopeptidase [bacterium]|nr:M23 family metallopeptidase [bacterium]
MAQAGVSGFGQQPRQRRGWGMWIFIGLVVAGLFYIGPKGYRAGNDLYQNFLERVKPTIKISSPPVGIGVEPQQLTIEVGDSAAGLDQVVIRLEQGGNTKELLKKNYAERTYADALALTLPGKDSGIQEGDAQLVVRVFDRSYWANGEQLVLPLKIDYKKPQLEVLTRQHYAAQGGVELVFYRVPKEEAVFSGVMVGEWLFPGFKAKELDAEFAKFPDVYFAFFPIPMELDVNAAKLKVFARDQVGNLVTATFNYQIRPRSFVEKKLELTDQFLEQKIEDLYPKFLELDQKTNGGPIRSGQVGKTVAERVEQFRSINEKYRALLEQSLIPLFQRPKRALYWEGVFGRMPNAAQQAGYGEKRFYSYQGESAGTSAHMGADLASLAQSSVTAANRGVVIFADDLGIYGNTVILDHGFGLCTLYGHLSSLAVTEGNEVERNDILGRSGATGLAGGDHLHFEIRLHGIPVTPFEWWDQKWIDDHVRNKIYEVKGALGIQVLKPVGERGF